MLATAVAKRVEIEVRDGYREPLNLFTVVALGPGNRKSAVFKDATMPLSAFEADETKRLSSEVSRSASRRKVLEKALARAQDEAAKANDDERLERLAAADRAAADLAAHQAVRAPRLRADDVTSEQLAVLLSENGERIAVLSPEGELFGMLAGRYQASGGPNLDVFLKGHAGDCLAVDRIGRERLILNAPALTVGLAIQPDVLRRLSDTPEFRGRGLLARFLYALPASRVGAREIAPPQTPETIRSTYHATVRNLLALETDRNDHGEAVPHILRLSPEARIALDDFAEWLEPRLSETGDLGLMVDWAAKLVGAVARIAGILHLAEESSGGRPCGVPVSAHTMDRAVIVGRYLIPHARAAFAQMEADTVVQDAVHVLNWLSRGGVANTTRREIFNATRGRFKVVEKLDPALEILEQHGFLRALPSPAQTGAGRRPSPSFAVNPASHTQNTHNTQNHPARLNSADIADCADTLPAAGDEVVL